MKTNYFFLSLFVLNLGLFGQANKQYVYRFTGENSGFGLVNLDKQWVNFSGSSSFPDSVVSVRDSIYYEYGIFNRKRPSSDDYTVCYQFNTAGVLTRKTERGGSVSCRLDEIFDVHGNIISRKCQWESCGYIWEHQYDSLSRLQISAYKGCLNDSSFTVYTYDAASRLVSELTLTYYTLELIGPIYHRSLTEYTYDLKGNLVRKMTSRSVKITDEFVDWNEEIYRYDEQNRMEEAYFLTRTKGAKDRWEKNVFGYDSAGNEIYRCRTTEDAAHFSVFQSEYDNQANLTRLTVGHHEKDSSGNDIITYQKTFDYQYDSYGNILYDSYLGYSYAYAYDAQGNWVKRICTSRRYRSNYSETIIRTIDYLK